MPNRSRALAVDALLDGTSRTHKITEAETLGFLVRPEDARARFSLSRARQAEPQSPPLRIYALHEGEVLEVPVQHVVLRLGEI